MRPGANTSFCPPAGLRATPCYHDLRVAADKGFRAYRPPILHREREVRPGKSCRFPFTLVSVPRGLFLLGIWVTSAHNRYPPGFLVCLFPLESGLSFPREGLKPHSRLPPAPALPVPSGPHGPSAPPPWAPSRVCLWFCYTFPLSLAFPFGEHPPNFPRHTLTHSSPDAKIHCPVRRTAVPYFGWMSSPLFRAFSTLLSFSVENV